LRGVIKIIAKRDGTIVGATIVGHRAGEAIAEVVLAMKNDLNVSDLAGTIHAYPTYSSGIQLPASEMSVDRVLRGDGLSRARDFKSKPLDSAHSSVSYAGKRAALRMF
jgi:hypothetical protein